MALVAANQAGAANQSLVVEIVNNTPELDSDGDSFADALETAVQAAPDDAASTPFGIPNGVFPVLDARKLTINLDFRRAG